MMNNAITPSLALLKLGLRTNQKSRRLVGWRKVVHRAVRYLVGIGVMYAFVKLLIYLV
jgi:hypothetical protein